MEKRMLTLLLIFITLSNVNAQSIEGLWKGKIDGMANFALEIDRSGSNEWSVKFYDLDHGFMQFEASTANIKSDSFNIEFRLIGRKIKGYRNSDDSLKASWVRPDRTSSMQMWRSEPILEIEERKRLVASGMSPYAPLGLGQFSFLIGTFRGYEKRSLGGPQEVLTMTEWKTEWILDGNAIQNESRGYVMIDSLSRGQMIQLGQDTRVYLRGSESWKHFYVDGFSDMLLSFDWEYKNGEFSSSPTEWGGSLNIIHFKNISENHFTWILDSSTDGGKTWVKASRVMENFRVE